MSAYSIDINANQSTISSLVCTTMTTAALNVTGSFRIGGELNRQSITASYTLSSGFSAASGGSGNVIPFVSSTLYNNQNNSSGLSLSSGVFTNNLGRTVLVFVSYTVYIQSNGAGTRLAYIEKGSQQYGQTHYRPNPSQIMMVTGSGIILLANNETFSVKFYQTSGSNLTLSSGTGNGTHVQYTIL